MHFQLRPSSRLAQTSPLVVAKYTPVGVAGIDGHRLALDREPRLRLRHPGRLPLPRLPAIHRAVDRRLAPRRDTRPDAAAIHRKHPERVGIARMQHHRKADRSDALGHRRAEVMPLLGRTIEAVDAGVVLLIEAVGQQRMQAHAMRIVPVLRVGIGQEIRTNAAIDRSPVRAGVRGLEYAAARHADIHVRRRCAGRRGSNAASARRACRPCRHRTTPCAADAR